MMWTHSSDSPALSCGCVNVTYAELHERIKAKEIRLLAMKIRCERAAIDLPDSFALIEWVLACWQHGITVMILDPRLTAAEKQARLDAFEPNVMILSSATEAQSALQRFHVQLEDRIEVYEGAITATSDGNPSRTIAGKDNPALVLFSSGSTGMPKTISRTFASIEREAVQYASEQGTPDGQSDVLCLVPVTHSFGLLSATLFTIKQGGSVRFLEILNPLGMLEAIRLESVTHVYGVAFHYQILSKALEMDRRELTGKPVFISSGGPLPDELASSLRSRWGISIGQQYGMSEVGYISVDAYGEVPGSAGRLAQHHDWRIDTEGQLVITLPVSPYSNQQSNWFDHPDRLGGELHTNDLVQVDPYGFIRIDGRLNDQVSIGGLKVRLEEIDHALIQHPDIEDSCTVCHEHPVLGTQLLSFIVWKSPADFSAARIQKWLKLSIADYKVPKSFRLIDRIPTSASGKRLKGELLKELEADGENARNQKVGG